MGWEPVWFEFIIYDGGFRNSSGLFFFSPVEGFCLLELWTTLVAIAENEKGTRQEDSLTVFALTQPFIHTSTRLLPEIALAVYIGVPRIIFMGPFPYVGRHFARTFFILKRIPDALTPGWMGEL